MPKLNTESILDNLDVFEGTYSNLTAFEGRCSFRTDRVETPEGIRAV